MKSKERHSLAAEQQLVWLVHPSGAFAHSTFDPFEKFQVSHIQRGLCLVCCVSSNSHIHRCRSFFLHQQFQGYSNDAPDMSDSEDPIDPIDDEGGDDLFGDEDSNEAAPSPPRARVLDDDSLASDPEEDDDARQQYNREERARSLPAEGQRRIMEAQINRHRIPKPSDNAVCYGHL